MSLVMLSQVTTHLDDRECTPDAFRESMRKLVGGVALICTADGDERFGLTATALCSVSAEPPTLLTCINRAGATAQAIRRSRAFSVNLLSSEQAELATAFSRASLAERFGFGEWSTGPSGAPILVQSLASFDCLLLEACDINTHTLFIGAVQVARSREGSGLGYFEGRFSLTRALA